MFGFWRRGRRLKGTAAVVSVVVPVFVALFLLAAPRTAQADELDDALHRSTLPVVQGHAPEAPVVSDGSDPAPKGDADKLTLDPVALALEQLWAADFHPETDRWTERNNRVKVSLLMSAMFFGNNLRVLDDVGIGLRVAWEVPGFISIRLDTTILPFSHIETRTINSSSGDGRRYTPGYLDMTCLTVGIFNPELSAAPNLAMWAGLGLDAVFYHYGGLIAGNHYTYVDQNVGGEFFFNLEYKIVDIFHVGLEWREHVLYAPQTEEGRGFVKVNGHTRGIHHERNQSFPVALSAITEFQLTVSVLF
jgi:hypothetical protein